MSANSYGWPTDSCFPPSTRHSAWWVYEAAAAELPLIVSKLHGLEDIAIDGYNAIVVEPNAESIANALVVFSKLSPSTRRLMGSRGRDAVRLFGVDSFAAEWRNFYASRGWSKIALDPRRRLRVRRTFVRLFGCTRAEPFVW